MYDKGWYTQVKCKILEMVQGIPLRIGKDDLVQEVMLALCELGGGKPNESKLHEAIDIVLHKIRPKQKRRGKTVHHVIEKPMNHNQLDHLDGNKIG